MASIQAAALGAVTIHFSDKIKEKGTAFHHTGEDEFTKFHGSLEFDGSVSVSRQDGGVADLFIDFRRITPILGTSEGGQYAKKVAVGQQSAGLINKQDIESQSSRGDTTHMKFKPGKLLEALDVNTRTGKVTLAYPNDSFVDSLKRRLTGHRTLRGRVD